MGTSSIVKNIKKCCGNCGSCLDLDKTHYFDDDIGTKSELLQQQSTNIKEISLNEFETLIPEKIYNLMIEDNFPNYNQSNDYSIRTTLEDSVNDEIKMYYHGEFNKDKEKHGKGKLVLIKDGIKTFYSGIWENDKIKEGKIYYENDGIYQGTIKDYLRDGEGTFESESEKYDGHWENDKKNGKGILTFKSDDTTYKGDFKDNLFNGKGELSTKNGFLYEGEFLENTMHGKGYLKGTNGHTYEGNFQNGHFHGKGKFKWTDKSNEEFYDGNYSYGKKDGNGSFHLQNGDIYTGDWKSGTPDGIGIYETENRKYEGNWRGGIFMQLIKVFDKNDAKEENVNLNFIIPSEDIYINDHISTSLNSNISKSCLLNVSMEVIKEQI